MKLGDYGITRQTFKVSSTHISWLWEGGMAGGLGFLNLAEVASLSV